LGGSTVPYLLFILSTPALYRRFWAFCETQGFEETLDFIFQVMEYKKHPNKKKAIAIIEDYVTNNIRVTCGGPGIRAPLDQKRQEYAYSRIMAKEMNWLQRVTTSAPRKADPNLFNDALEVAQQMVINGPLNEWFNMDDGQRIKNHIDGRLTKIMRTQKVLNDTFLF
jgi:hypothetical protein